MILKNIVFRVQWDGFFDFNQSMRSSFYYHSHLIYHTIALKKIDNKFPFITDNKETNFQSYHILLDKNIKRDKLIKYLYRHKIETKMES